MATIKSLSKCFQEVKRLTGNLLSDEKINLLLDEAKIKINDIINNKLRCKTLTVANLYFVEYSKKIDPN